MALPARAIADVVHTARTAHDAGGTLEVIVAVAWDCPFDGLTPAARKAQLCARALGAPSRRSAALTAGDR